MKLHLSRLLPPIDRLRDVARVIARAVARGARDERLCKAFGDDELGALIEDRIWAPDYRPYVRSGD